MWSREVKLVKNKNKFGICWNPTAGNTRHEKLEFLGITYFISTVQ